VKRYLRTEQIVIDLYSYRINDAVMMNYIEYFR